MSDPDVELVRRALLAFELDPEPDRFAEFFDSGDAIRAVEDRG